LLAANQPATAGTSAGQELEIKGQPARRPSIAPAKFPDTRCSVISHSN